MRLKIVTKPFCVPDTLIQWGELFPRSIELIAIESRKHVQVVVPDILVSGRLIVLPRRDAIATVNGLQRDGHAFGHPVNAVGEAKGQLVDVLVVLSGDNEHVTGIIRPPVPADDLKNDTF